MELKEVMKKFAEFVEERSNGEMILLYETRVYTSITPVKIEFKERNIGYNLFYDFAKNDENDFKNQITSAIMTLKRYILTRR